MKKTILSTLLLFLVLGGFAQAPAGINYQAIARTSSGAPVSSSVNLSVNFKIRTGSASGTIQYEEVHSPVNTNPYGLFTVVIGNGTPVSGTLAGVAWGSGAKYLEVTIDDGSGPVSLGTTQLQSVPYALYSANGPVGATGATGSTGLSGTNGVDGATGATGANGATGATGTAGTNGTDGATGATGVAGATGANGTNGADGATGATGAAGTTGATGTAGAAGATGATGTAGTNGFTILNGTSNPTAGIGVNGDFYINTSTNTIWGPKSGGTWPGSGVSLVGPAGASGATGATGTAGATGATGPSWTISSNNYSTSGFQTISTSIPSAITSNFAAWLTNGNSGTVPTTNFLGTTDMQDLVFRTNNVERMRMTIGGFVGIGTTSPVAMLDISGNIRLNNKVMLGPVGGINSGYTGIYENAGDLRLAVFKPGSTTAFGTNSLDAVTIKSNTGVVNVSSLAPGGVVVANASGDLGLMPGNPITGTGTTNYLPKWNAAGTGLTPTSLVFDNGTGVGIGTNAPTQTLQVSNTSVSPAVSIVTSSTLTAFLLFGTPSFNNKGVIRYDNGTNTMDFWTNNTPRMTIDGNGHHGFYGPPDVNYSILAYNNPGNAAFGLDNNGVKIGDVLGGSVGNYFYTDFEGAGNFQFIGGPVGIGTTTPSVSYRTTIYNSGSSGLLNLQSGVSSTQITMDDSGANDVYVTSTLGDFDIWTGGNNRRFTVLTNGNIGVNSIVPASRLEIRGSGTTSSTSSLNVLNSSSVSSLYVGDDGKVGIGTISPGTSLHVSGAITNSAWYRSYGGTGGVLNPGNEGYIRINAAVNMTIGSMGPGSTIGEHLILENPNASTTVTLTDGAGVQLNGNVNYTMGPGDTIQLIWNGTYWLEVSRSNN